MQRGGQPGNTNSTKKHLLWGDTLRRAIAQDNGKKLRQAAEALLDAAAGGDLAAIKELGDRIDGRAVQSIADFGAGDDIPAVQMSRLELARRIAFLLYGGLAEIDTKQPKVIEGIVDKTVR